MRFISKFPTLKIYITPRKTMRDPVTSEIIEVNPGIVARFEKNVFQSDEKVFVQGMLRKFAYAREHGIATTFSVHPEDLKDAEEIMKTINPEVAETFVKKGVAAEKLTAQEAMNDHTQATLNTLLDAVGKLAESVSSLQAKVDAVTPGEETNPRESKSAPKGTGGRKKKATDAPKAPSSASSGEPNPS